MLKQKEELEKEEFEEMKIARYQLNLKNKKSKYFKLSEIKIVSSKNKLKKEIYQIILYTTL